MSRQNSRNGGRKICENQHSDVEIPKKPVRIPPLSIADLSKAFSTAGQRRKLPNLDSKFLFENPKSVLASKDLRSTLNRCAWGLLDAHEQRECRQLLPAVDKVDGTGDLIPDFFEHNLFLQDSVRQFQDRLSAGFFTPAHVRKSIKASRDRLDGAADVFKDEQFEEVWGEKQKLDHGLLTREASNLKLTTMIMRDIFQVGDIFKYSRTIGLRQGKKKKIKCLVEKECEVIRIVSSDETKTQRELAFKIPLGPVKYLGPKEETSEIDGIISLSQLETSILDADARVPREERPNGNSWKMFRLQRKVTDLGSLWEIRDQAFSD